MWHQVENYVHRIGRTGRSGRNGAAISLVSDREMSRLKVIETNLNRGAMRLWRADGSGPQSDEQGAQLTLATPNVHTLEINGGRKQKLRPGDILGALTAGGALGADAVGKIDILPMVSYVAIAKEHTSVAQRLLNQHKIKGRQFRARGVG